MPIPLPQQLIFEAQVVGIAATGGSNSRPYIVTTHWRRTAPGLPLTKAALDTIFQASIVVPMCAALNNRYTQQRNRIRCLNDGLDPYFDFAHAVVSGVAGDGMPTSQSAFLFARTGLRGRSYRGSIHLGPLSEADTTAGTDDIFNAAALARLAPLAAAWLAGFTDALNNVWVPSVVSKKFSVLTTSPATVVANDINYTAVNKRIGSMRHRKVKSVY